jgi:hypothetical protein
LLKRSGLSNVLLGSLFDDKENAAFRSGKLLPGEQANPILQSRFSKAAAAAGKKSQFLFATRLQNTSAGCHSPVNCRKMASSRRKTALEGQWP